ncbi:MAG: glutamate-5-semialdehyde dehydrogenase [Candidatus Caenarcaniphilales bacterium]|nr:glutamate-5-semialdehyde dehydrogenase [Candidatus Caenarcaniphilales bacterium]
MSTTAKAKTINETIDNVKANWPRLAVLSHEERQKIILGIAQVLDEKAKELIAANAKDLEVAAQDNLSKALTDRLSLNEARLKGMTNGLRKIANLADPLDDTIEWQNPKGLTIKKIRVPIGVILVVYEARPNVTTDTVGLSIKTGNSAILKGSRQTKFSNSAIAEVIKEVLKKHQLEETIEFYPELNSEQSMELVSHPKLDLIIPRGGEGLKKFVTTHAKAPILGAGGGICHVYISESADLEKAKNIIFNAKTQRPGVCNAIETVLIHESHLKKNEIEELFKPLLDFGVLIKADTEIQKLNSKFEEAKEEDWSTEYLDLILSVKSVSSTEEAIGHINKYSTGHSDCIVTENMQEAERFCQLVDSGCVYVNASTRFTDGEEFGFGAEIGISTQKMHARGPIGPRELTTYKYLILGDGQVR